MFGDRTFLSEGVLFLVVLMSLAFLASIDYTL